jgi:hypothetical protein
MRLGGSGIRQRRKLPEQLPADARFRDALQELDSQ